MVKGAALEEGARGLFQRINSVLFWSACKNKLYWNN